MLDLLDPGLLLAYAVYTSPGVYAVLLGSGASSAAGVPTGWSITVDLARRLAAIEGADASGDPEAWYRSKFDEPLNYSTLVGLLGRTPAERQAILREYFEPTPADRGKGLKLPTEAHRAIARLVVGGSIRVIITTNFDRLIEQALTEVGADFDVIAGADSLLGARPPVHSPAIVVKLHGDYRDARIRNTEEELAAYPPEINALLDRLLDEHGLVVCGWSASWDPALRSAILRQPGRRYTTYWAVRHAMSSEAADLVRARDAVVIPETDAETLFSRLADHVDALGRIARPHPVSKAVALAELKQLLPDERSQDPRIRDLLVGEADKIVAALGGDAFALPDQGVTTDDLRERVLRCEVLSETVLSLISTGCAWAQDGRPFVETIERLANAPARDRNLPTPGRFVGLLCLYAGGLAAVFASRWEILASITYGAMVTEGRAPIPAANALSIWRMFSSDPKWLPGMERHYAPASDHLYEAVREPLMDVIRLDARYEETFLRFEYLLGLIVQDQINSGVEGVPRAPIGRLGWKKDFSQGAADPVGEIVAEAAECGDSWPPLRAGLFGGQMDRFVHAAEQYKQVVEWARSSWH